MKLTREELAHLKWYKTTFEYRYWFQHNMIMNVNESTAGFLERSSKAMNELFEFIKRDAKRNKKAIDAYLENLNTLEGKA